MLKRFLAIAIVLSLTAGMITIPALADDNEEFFKELVFNHTSGQLKVAPEHCSDNVLNYMGKPSFKVYKKQQKR